MTVDSTGDRAGAPTRTLPASWPDLAFGGAVLVVGLIGVSLNVISAQLQVAGVLMALVTTAMTGPEQTMPMTATAFGPWASIRSSRSPVLPR